MKGIVIAVILSSAAWTQTKLQPLNVKTGLWESTVTSTTSGQMPIPAEMLAKLSPEQRAKIEARMQQNSGQRSRTRTNRDCETKEKLEKQLFNDEKQCKQTIISSTSTAAEVKMVCEFDDVKSNGTMHIDVLSPESVKGSGQMTSSGGGHTMTMNTSFTAKWLGPSCGDTK
ncbi:MAG TPA: DUF3617 domain-containing protein [Terriglobales bacterium]|jgi:hypothetical protein|nr:DUF3617 domain-containing protein [Terriglobales bacterium]